MNTDEVAYLNEAREALARQRNAIARKLSPLDYARRDAGDDGRGGPTGVVTTGLLHIMARDNLK